MSKIKEIIEQNKLNVKDNIINFGYQNGLIYNKRLWDVFKSLNELAIKDTHTSETVGRCETEYRFQITDGFETYTVVSKVDSGD